MIFFAVATPTLGRASNCAWVAVLRSTGPAAAAAVLALAAAAPAGRARASSADRASNDIVRALLNDILDFLSGSLGWQRDIAPLRLWSPQSMRVALRLGLQV